MRVKLLDDDIKDTDIDPKPQKSVHWSTEGRPSCDFHFNFHSNKWFTELGRLSKLEELLIVTVL